MFESYYELPEFLWSLFIQSVTAFLAVPTEIPHAGLGLIEDIQIQILPVDRQFHYFQ
jgi:hypothetical protein